MAEIFLARVVGIPALNKTVVLKRMLPQLAQQRDFIEMFLDEARIAATLQHPNVVQTYDVGVANGSYFIAMEYLHGEDLLSITKALTREGRPWPIEHVLNVVISLCAGLHYTHEKRNANGKPLNIVHRDVTPTNVIVTYDGHVKLLDFGIARSADRARQTRYGGLKGKFPYMSPEQCRGEPLDRRSDIFSLGVVIYELTLGRRPFGGATDYLLMQEIVSRPAVAPRAIDPSYPPALEALVLRALSKDRAERYPTVAEMQDDLEALARASGLFLSTTGLKALLHTLFGTPEEGRPRLCLDRAPTIQEAAPSIRSAPGSSLPLDIEVAAPIEEREASGPDESASSLVQAEIVSRSVIPDRSPGGAALRVMLEALATMTLAAQAGRSGRPRRGQLGLTLLVALVAASATVAAFLYLSPRRAEPPVPPPATAAAPIVTPLPTPPAPSPSREPQLNAVAPPPAKTRSSPAASTAKRHRGSAALPPPGGASHKATESGATRRRCEEPSLALAGETAQGTLLLASEPWCLVKIDGHDRGPTPIRINLPAGQHRVVLDNDEFAMHRRLTVTVPPHDVVRVHVDR
jgi:serine/threonine protein kinase